MFTCRGQVKTDIKTDNLNQLQLHVCSYTINTLLCGQTGISIVLKPFISTKNIKINDPIFREREGEQEGVETLTWGVTTRPEWDTEIAAIRAYG